MPTINEPQLPELKLGPTTDGGLWATIREAIRGSSIDYTTAPVGQCIVMLAVPMVMEMAMESIFVVADVFWVAHLGANAVATVGLTESMLTLVYSLAMGVSIGAMALVARRIGEADPEGAARAGVQAIALGVIASVLIAIFGSWNAANLLRLMGASDEVVATGTAYTRVMMGGNATIVLLFLINAVFRGAGDAAIAMRVLWIGNAINIVLGPCLIFGPGPFPALGVTGAAVATNIGRGTAVLIQLLTLTRWGTRVRVARRHLGFDPAAMKTVLRLSGSGTVQILIATASYVALVRILSQFGSAALAGYTIGIRLIIFALLPSFGISNAAATMVGQNLGARKPDRAERAVWTAAFYNLLFLGAIGADLPGRRRRHRLVLHERRDRRRLRGLVPAHRQPGLRLLRLRHGAHAVVQRRRRHVDADADQPAGVLGHRAAAGVGAVARGRPRGQRRVRRAGRLLLAPRRRERRRVPAGAMEDEGSLSHGLTLIQIVTE